VEAQQRVAAVAEAQQQLIQMANRSELSWWVVQNYVSKLAHLSATPAGNVPPEP